MTFDGSLHFVATSWGLTAAVCLVLATAALCWVAWQRSGFRPVVGATELLRLLIVTLVGVMLNQPEWLERYVPEEAPTVLVLSDTSRSMQTRDVLSSETTTGTPMTRTQAIAPLGKPSAWQSLENRFQIVCQPFSSQLPRPSDGTDINAALQDGLQKHRNLQAIVLLSDGDWNAGEPPTNAASTLRSRNIPIFAVAVGAESRLPDVELARVDALAFGVAGKPLRIPLVVDSSLPRDFTTTVTMTPSKGEPVSMPITIPAMGRLEEALIWRPQEVGEFQLTVEVPQHSDELLADNNRLQVPIVIREEAIKVLLIESVPRWEYRYLRNALERDPGVDVSCLLLHPDLGKPGGGRGYLKAFPETQQLLGEYDVVFLGDVGLGDNGLSHEQCRLLKGLVRNQASGLILMPGMRGAQGSLENTELEELLPVVLNPEQPRGWGSRVPSQFELSDAGRGSLLTRLEDAEDDNALLWESLPGFQWFAPVLRAKAGSEVLATHKSEMNQYGRIPLLVTRSFGTGKVLFMGTDGAFRWREGVEDKYHYRFWGQVVRWMAYQRSMAQGEGLRLFHAPDRPQSGATVMLHANVMDRSGEPLQEGLVVVQIQSPSGATESLRLTAQDDSWGLFTGTFTPKESGDYQLTLLSKDNGGQLQLKMPVQGQVREKLGQPARHDLLKEMAELTRGALVEADRVEQLVAQLAALPYPEPQIRRLRLWCHPLWIGSLILLLGLFWTSRKMWGAI